MRLGVGMSGWATRGQCLWSWHRWWDGEKKEKKKEGIDHHTGFDGHLFAVLSIVAMTALSWCWVQGVRPVMDQTCVVTGTQQWRLVSAGGQTRHGPYLRGDRYPTMMFSQCRGSDLSWTRPAWWQVPTMFHKWSTCLLYACTFVWFFLGPSIEMGCIP